MSKVTIGDVIVNYGGNPRAGPGGLIGNDRVEALKKFYSGEETPGLFFWHAPHGGPVKPITRGEVSWDSSGVPDLCGGKP